MSAELLDHANPRVLVDIPRYEVRVTADEQQIIASYNRTTYQDEADQIREPDNADDVICNIQEAALIVAANPAFSLLGFETDTPTPNTHRVVGPSNPLLNKSRAELAATTGIHSGTFVDTTEAFIDFPEFLQLLSQKIIPMSGRPDSIYVAHDNIFHRLGYAKMCSAIFNRFVGMAGIAVNSGDKALIENVAIIFDQIGGLIGYDKGGDPEKLGRNLANQYKKLMHPFAAGVLAAADAQAQAATDAKLQRLAELHADFTA